MELNEKQPKVSVIVPIYNVEQYIEKCVRSLMEQTLEDIEFIFVNDCTPDDSMTVLRRVLKDYPARESQVTILEHKENRGLAAVRKTGMEVAIGEYIIHCDSDDWVEKNMYEKLLEKAIETEADIIGCDFYNDYVGRSVVQKQSFVTDSKECVRKMLRGELYCSTWNKLISRKLWERSNVSFKEEINMWEDVSVIIPLCFWANKIAYVPEPLYHYGHYNATSYIYSMSEKSLMNMIEVIAMLDNFFQCQHYFETFEKDFRFMKLTVKLNLLLGSKGEQQRMWNRLYPEANSVINEYHVISFYWRVGLQLATWGCLFLFNILARIGKILRSMRCK